MAASSSAGGVLQNTGAGIKIGKTFKMKAWARVNKKGRVVLVFEESVDEDNDMGIEGDEVHGGTNKVGAGLVVEATLSTLDHLKREGRPHTAASRSKDMTTAKPKLRPGPLFRQTLRPVRFKRARMRKNSQIREPDLRADLERVEVGVTYS